MQFTISAAAFLAFASTALAQIPGFDTITKPQTGEILAAGDTYTVVWDPSPAQYDDETISIFLLAGATPQTLIPSEAPIASGIVNKLGTYNWAVPLSLGDQEIYGLIIRLESNAEIFQYSFPFHVKADEAAPSNSTDEPTVSATDSAIATATAPGNSTSIVSSATAQPTISTNMTMTTAAPPKTTIITSSSTSSSSSSRTSSDDAEPTETEDESPESGAAGNGMMGAFALVAAVAAAAFAL